MPKRRVTIHTRTYYIRSLLAIAKGNAWRLSILIIIPRLNVEIAIYYGVLLGRRLTCPTWTYNTFELVIHHFFLAYHSSLHFRQNEGVCADGKRNEMTLELNSQTSNSIFAFRISNKSLNRGEVSRSLG